MSVSRRVRRRIEEILRTQGPGRNRPGRAPGSAAAGPAPERPRDSQQGNTETHRADAENHARGARRGIGRAQLGLALQLAVIEDREEYHKDFPADQLVERERRPVAFHVLVNPVITEMSEERAEFFEGCLSLSGFLGLVPRARRVCVECLDEHGRQKQIAASGWYARILQHEIDHLQGTLYIDRMESVTFTSMDNWNQFWKALPVAEIRKQLG